MDHLIQIPQVGRAWEPIPEPWVTLGMLAGLDTGLRLGTLVTPVTSGRPASPPRPPPPSTCSPAAGRSSGSAPAGGSASTRRTACPSRRRASGSTSLESAIETMRALWAAGTKAYAGDAGQPARDDVATRARSAPIPIIVGGAGEQRTLRIAARLGDAINVSSRPEHARPQDRRAPRHCRDVGRDPAEVAVTVLDLPVIGRDRDDTWARVERLRGRTPAAAYAGAPTPARSPSSATATAGSPSAV